MVSSSFELEVRTRRNPLSCMVNELAWVTTNFSGNATSIQKGRLEALLGETVTIATELV
jgi:hypothetical protein